MHLLYLLSHHGHGHRDYRSVELRDHLFSVSYAEVSQRARRTKAKFLAQRFRKANSGFFVCGHGGRDVCGQDGKFRREKLGCGLRLKNLQRHTEADT